MIKAIYCLVGLNTVALIIFIGAYFVINEGKNVSYEEKGWTIILSTIGLIVILLAALPLRFSHSTFTLIFSGFFAALPLIIAAWVLINNKLSSIVKKPDFAATYYKDKTQRSIAAAIEKNDTVLLKELIKGQDLNIQGIRVWDWDGLNYLQFAIRIRSRAHDFPFDDKANLAAIHILVENGCATTRALAEAVTCMPPEEVALLLDAGADPNTSGFVNPYPLLFEVIDKNREKTDMIILLLQKGADVNVKHENGFTPVMYTAFTAGTTTRWNDMWRLVLYMLEDAKCDYRYAKENGMDLKNVIEQIRTEAAEKNIVMPPGFYTVVDWLKQHKIDTTPPAVKD
ncbi:hypothetical protein BH11BAC3_BH11BAC3_27350 [soil metagenome]